MKPNADDWTRQLDIEYDRASGFLGKLRSGQFDASAQERFLSVLRSIEPTDGCIDRRLVSLLWYAPLMMGWQIDRVPARDAAALREALDAVTTELERILGVP